MNNVINIYKVTTNINDGNGSKLHFMVAADNPKNVIYVATDCVYNGQMITSENITSIQLVMTRVVTSYHDTIANDLNPDYIKSSTNDVEEDK